MLFSVFGSDGGHDSAPGFFFLWCLLAISRRRSLLELSGFVVIVRPVVQYPRILFNWKISSVFNHILYRLTMLLGWDRRR